MKFQNPTNGFTETAGAPFLWCLLFGCFYFAFKGVWNHAVISFVVAILTVGLGWLIYPFFASGIVRSHYLRMGWQQVS